MVSFLFFFSLVSLTRSSKTIRTLIQRTCRLLSLHVSLLKQHEESVSPFPFASLWLLPICRHRHEHIRHIHGRKGSSGHNNKGAHHVMVLVLQNMTMVHVAACEAIKGCRYRDHFSRVDPHRIFPAQFVRIESPMPLKADGCCRCSCFWMEAVLLVEVSAQHLELDEMHMERMGVFRQIEDTPNLCRTIFYEPVDSILKMAGDGVIAPSFSLLIRYYYERFSRYGITIRHFSKFTKGEHAVGILDHRDHAMLVSRGQPVMFESAVRRGYCRGQDEGVIHRLR